MISFSKFCQECKECQGKNIHEGLGNFIARRFGFGKSPEERLEIARDAIRNDKLIYKNKGLSRVWAITKFAFSQMSRGGAAGKAFMQVPDAWEYVYVWGKPEEKREAEAWLNANRRITRNRNHPMSYLQDFWAHDAKYAAFIFGSTKCCYTGPRGSIKV